MSGARNKAGSPDPARNHHVSAGDQCFCNRLGAEIGIGGKDAITKIPHPAVYLQQWQIALLADVKNVVASYRGDPQRSNPQLLGNLPSLRGRCTRIRGSHIGNNFDALRFTDLQHSAHPLLQQRIIAGGRIPHFFLLGQRDRSLG
jgi:hypothetical protein